MSFSKCGRPILYLVKIDADILHLDKFIKTSVNFGSEQNKFKAVKGNVTSSIRNIPSTELLTYDSYLFGII